MPGPRSSSRTGVFTVLLVYIGLLSVAQVPTSQGGAIRLGGFSILAPLVASALLSYRRTLIVCGVTMAALVFIYGGVVPGLPVVQRVVTIVLVSLAAAASLLVCRVRIEREERIRRLMIARDRLTLLTEAGERVGSTLDISRTARELADIAVPRFADLTAVDLFDTVLSGDEPPALTTEEPVILQRMAYRTSRAQAGQGPGSGPGSDPGPGPGSDPGPGPGSDPGPGPGGPRVYPLDSVPGRALVSGRPILASITGTADAADWLGTADPQAAAGAADSGPGSGSGPEPAPAAPGHRAARAYRSGIAVPLRARGTTLGLAIFVREAHSEPFDADDLLLAEEIGARSAVCVDNARRYTREHLVALALQHSLLPHGLPEQDAVEAAYRYLPAQQGAGGDWYDVIPLSGARVALVVGDVMGHGLHAAATMGRLRTAVDNYAALDLPPEDLLTNLGDLVGRLGIEDYLATCLYGVYDPVSRLCTFASAGHPPPALVLPDGTVKYLDIPAGPPLGVGGTPFESVEVTVPEGTRLALYTDGLIELRNRHVDTGMDMLRNALADRPDRSPDEMCEAVMETMLDGNSRDDAALLIVRTQGFDADRWADWEVPGDPEAVSAARDKVLRKLEEWGLTELAFSTELIVSELATNAIRYAGPPISLRLLREDHALICEVSDGSSTSPRLRRADVADEGGRGLFLVAQLAQRWGTRYTPKGKIIWAEQQLP
ncbi:SpoIIE family protein phosphatase [Streptomyces sp. NPDC005808]|uniref:ATP-binding SpoIIE family protein phosphatase n=1 Tax=Streptomyces sp. NPDC005808 TaxID=3364734 RepID=UPI00369C981A